MLEIQDSGSWRDQEDNDMNYFPVMMRPTAGRDCPLASARRLRHREAITMCMQHRTRTIHNSKYLKASQELLDEVVNVKKALKQFQPDGDKIDEEKEKNLQESSTNPDIPQAERQELQNKLSKLVDRRYKQYYHQMQIVVSSFDVLTGCGAARPSREKLTCR